MSNNNKKIGLGTLSLILAIMGILFAFSFGDKECYGDIILRYINLKPWTNGNEGLHLTVFYSLIFFIPSFFLGYKFKNDFGSKIGKITSLIMLILILLLFPIFGALRF
jgi:FtsH-binding integral membrane protein